ncbi:MAG: hypothetical protein AABW75_04130 [Nanoarchaeota archaeon]
MKIGNKKGIIGFIITLIVILIVAGFIFYISTNNASSENGSKSVSGNVLKVSGGEESVEQAGQKTSNPKEYTIEITSSGFSPNNLEIKQGDSVTWINKDSKEHWPASASHPTHTVYTGGNYNEAGSYMGSQACKSESIAKTGAFDPCKGLGKEENWSFVFNEKGSWSYHDHLVSGRFGKIIVS